MEEQLIGDPRQDFFDEWGMDEHVVGQNLGVAGHNPYGNAGVSGNNYGMNQNMGNDDDEIQRAILESMKNHGGGDDLEE